MPALTYGKLPSLRAFERAFDRHVRGSTFGIRLSRRDARAAENTSIGDGRYTAHELYRGLRELVDEWEDGNDRAGDLASSILDRLGFEWV